MVEQAARVPSSRGRARELLRNSLRFPDPDPDPAPKMQLGLRFAAAKLPGLRTDRGAGATWSQAGPWWPEEAIESSGTLLSPTGRSVVE